MGSFTDIATLTAVVWGVTQGIKTAIGTKFNRFLPLVSDVLGVAAGYLFLGGTRDAALLGLIVGLSASGLYSQGKAVVGR